MKLPRLLCVLFAVVSLAASAAQPPDTQRACTTYADSVLRVRWPAKLGGLQMVSRVTFGGDFDYRMTYDSVTNRTDETGRLLDVIVFTRDESQKIEDGCGPTVRQELASAAEAVLGTKRYLGTRLADKMSENVLPESHLKYLWFSHTLRHEEGGGLHQSVTVLWAWRNRCIKLRYHEPAASEDAQPLTQIPKTLAHALAEIDALIVAAEKAAKVDVYAIEDPAQALAALQEKWAGVEDALPASDQPDCSDAEADAVRRLRWAAENFDERQAVAFDACQTGIRLKTMPYRWYYNYATVLAECGKKEEAWIVLEQAVAAGYGWEDVLNNDKSLTPLRTDPRFPRLLAMARRVPLELSCPPKDAMIIKGRLTITDENAKWWFEDQAYSIELQHFQIPRSALIVADLDRPEGIVASKNRIAVAWDQPFVKKGRNYPPAKSYFTLENHPSSTVPNLQVSSTLLASNPTNLAQSAAALMWGYTEWSKDSEKLLARNTLGLYYIGPDYGADGVDRLTGWGPTSLAFYNAADREPFIQLCTDAWLALTPEMREKGGIRQLLDLIRRGQICVKTEDDFLSPAAQRPAFSLRDLDRKRILKLAKGLKKPYPSMPQIENVTISSEMIPMTDLWDQPFDRPVMCQSYHHAVVVHRLAEKTIKFQVAVKPTKRGHLVWKVLQGDAAKVRITPEEMTEKAKAAGLVGHEIACDYHAAFDVALSNGRKMKSTRVDIGCFNIEDGVASLPAIFSVFFQPGETRVYGEDGRLVSVDYAQRQIPGWLPTFCPRADFKDTFHWTADGCCTGWTRTDREGKQTEFTREGLVVMTRDELGRPKDVRRSLTMEWLQELDSVVNTGREFRVRLNAKAIQYDQNRKRPLETTLAWHYTYTNATDRFGIVSPRPSAPFAYKPELCPRAALTKASGFRLPLVRQMMLGDQRMARYKYDNFDHEATEFEVGEDLLRSDCRFALAEKGLTPPHRLQPMKFSTGGKCVSLAWRINLDSVEEAMAKELVEQSDGAYRRHIRGREEESSSVFWSVQDTLRWANTTLERAAYERLDGAFKRCTDFETRQILAKAYRPKIWQKVVVAEKKPIAAGDLPEDKTQVMALWRISKNLCFMIRADYDSGFWAREYAFVQLGEDGFAELFDSFDELPSGKIGNTVINSYEGRPEAMNDFAVLCYAGIANPGNYDEKAVKQLLEMAAAFGCKEAKYNLGVLKYNRGELK